MRFRRNVSLLLSLVLAAAVFTSCGGKKTDGDTVTTAPEGTVQVSGSADSGTAEGEGASDTTAFESGTDMTTSDPSADTPAVDTVPYETFVGWWFRPGSYFSEERSYFDYFCVNEDGTYTKYNKYGAAVYTLPCRVEGTAIIFELEDGGSVTCYFDGRNLNSAEGIVQYVAGEPMNEFDMTSVVGKWYRFGDRTAESLTLYDGGYTYTDVGEEKEGTWTVTEGTIIRADGTVEDDMQFVFTDAVGKKSTYSLADGGAVLYDSEYGDAYIHESVLALDYGQDMARIFTLVCYTWEGETRDLTFSYYDSTFSVTEYVTDGDDIVETTAVAGRWSISGAELLLEFDDPELADEATPFEGESIFVATYRETFERSRF